jgi:hypothetical protein
MATSNGKVAGLLIRAALQYLRKTAKRKRETQRAERRAPKTSSAGDTSYGTVLPPTPTRDDSV